MEIVRRTHRQTGAPVIPPVDVFTMQLHLPGGRFPPSYGARDMVASRCSAAS